MVDPELVAIGAEAPARLTDLGVMPEPGGEGEEPQPDAGAQARECAGAVALEAELSLAGPKARFDPLAHAPERSELERLVLAIGTKELGSEIGHPALELGAPNRLARGRAGDRGRIEQPQLIAPPRRAEGEVVDRSLDLWGERAQTLVVARLTWQVGEQVREPVAGERPEIGGRSAVP